MEREAIIKSNIDTDNYKLTMGQLVFHGFPNLKVGYEFINRGKTEFPDQFDINLQRQVEMMSEVKLQPEEKKFLLTSSSGTLTQDFVEWFSKYQFNPDEVTIRREDGGLQINIDGLWGRTIYWEVPLMAVISELYFKETNQLPTIDWREEARKKAQFLESIGAPFAEFGTRRRYSYTVHKEVLQILKENAPTSLVGTSNLQLAMELGLTPVGTFAHELVMGIAGIFGPENANRIVMELWAKEFGGKLSTALTDTFTTEVFLRSYNGQSAEIFKTLRQDSGSPEKWTDLILAHLNSLGIDPLTRTALYSDSLDVKRVLEIIEYNKNRIKALFGIGTNLTNDVGAKPLNMVIKLLYIMLEGKRVDVCKISDDPGKISGGPEAVQNWPRILGVPIFAQAGRAK